MRNLRGNKWFCFELYKIQKTDKGIWTIKTNVRLDQVGAEKIKDHITWFFDSKNSYYKHLEVPDLPTWWLKSFSDPIETVFQSSNNGTDFKYLIDSFIKQWLSPQSHNMARRDKYLLIMYKKSDFFILAHLTVKKWITLEGDNLEISNLLFSSDTLLRYIHITMTENKKYDMVIWEQTLTQTFIKFLDIWEEFFNKDSYWELCISWKSNGTSITIEYSPADFFKKYISKEIKLIKENGQVKISDNYGLNICVDKIIAWNKTININKAFEISFFEKLAINTAISDALQPLNQLNLFSDSTLIEEWKRQIKVWTTYIQKIFPNSDDDCIYFSFPLWSNPINVQYNLEEAFLDFIYDSLFFKEDKKIIVFSLYEKKLEEYLNTSFQDIFSNCTIYFPNLFLEENVKIDEEIKLIRKKIKDCDSEIMKWIYKMYLLIDFCFYLQSYPHLFAYFKLLLNKCIQRFSEMKSVMFSESENNILEYKSWMALSFDTNWKESAYNRIKSDIEVKIKKINPWCILYWFDESERKIDWIPKKDFKKINDDILTEFEENIKKDCDLEYIRIYKIPGELNILLIYIRKL